MQGTAGAVCVLGGNNNSSDVNYGIATTSTSIQTIQMASNFDDDSDYISVLAFM